jgi:hypothetical protein
MRRTGWTVAMAGVAVVAIGGAQLVGTSGYGNGSGVERRTCTERTLRGSYVFSATGSNIVLATRTSRGVREFSQE